MKHFIKITFVVQYGVCTILFLSLVNDQTIIVSHDDELVSISNTVTDLIAKIAYILLLLWRDFLQKRPENGRPPICTDRTKIKTPRERSDREAGFAFLITCNTIHHLSDWTTTKYQSISKTSSATWLSNFIAYYSEWGG
jgi:hypothetical protein